MHNIVYITDDNYVLPTKTSINSIVKNITDTEICVNVIAVDVSAQNQNELKRLSSKNISVKVVNFSNEFADLGLDHHYVSKAALFKFQLPNIFSDLERILYVDGDMILYPEFLEIFDFNISEKYAAVVSDMLACFMGFDKKLGHEKYFNSGMMYLNLKKMREENITNKLIEYKKTDTDKSFMDQNALNAILGLNSLWISPKFNLMATCTEEQVNSFYQDGLPLYHMAQFYEISENAMKNAIESPAILHVTSETKAWKNITAKRIDDWISFVQPSDSLKIAKNYSVALSLEFEKKIEEQNKTTESKMEALENMNKESERNILNAIEGMITEFRNRETIITELELKSENLERKFTNLQGSLSFKVGRAVTFLPRKIRNLFKNYTPPRI